MKMDECIDLKKHFGEKFRVKFEESYYAERTVDSLVDPWMMIIPCRHGHIFPHGGNLLAASVEHGHTVIAGQLRRLPCCKVHQDGDFGELTVLFDVADFDRVASIMLPRRRREISEAERERLRAMSAKYGFKRISNDVHTARQCVASTSADSQAVQGVGTQN